MGNDKSKIAWTMDPSLGYVLTESITLAGDSACPVPATAPQSRKPIQTGVAMLIATSLPTGYVSPTYTPDSSFVCTTNSAGLLTCAGDISDRGYIPNGLTAASLQTILAARPTPNLFFNRFMAFNVFQSGGGRDIFT